MLPKAACYCHVIALVLTLHLRGLSLPFSGAAPHALLSPNLPPCFCLSPTMQDFAVKLPSGLVQWLQELASGQNVLCWQHIPKSLLDALHDKASLCETLKIMHGEYPGILVLLFSCLQASRV